MATPACQPWTPIRGVARQGIMECVGLRARVGAGSTGDWSSGGMPHATLASTVVYLRDDASGQMIGERERRFLHAMHD